MIHDTAIQNSTPDGPPPPQYKVVVVLVEAAVVDGLAEAHRPAAPAVASRRLRSAAPMAVAAVVPQALAEKPNLRSLAAAPLAVRQLGTQAAVPSVERQTASPLVAWPSATLDLVRQFLGVADVLEVDAPLTQKPKQKTNQLSRRRDGS